MSRADEIAQGLREPRGALIGGLDVFECAKAAEDFRAGLPPPRVTSASYDLWRARLAREADEDREFRAKLRADDLASRKRVRAVIAEAGRPDVLADYDAKMAELDALHCDDPGSRG